MLKIGLRCDMRLLDRVRVTKAIFIITLLLVSVCLSQITPRSVEAACPTLPTDKGHITSSVAIPSGGNYYIWSRNRTANSNNSAYFLQVDNNCGVMVGKVGIPANTWTWVDYQDGKSTNRMQVQLTEGNHTLKLHGLDPSVQVDRILLTLDQNCIPNGAGDNCTGEVTAPIQQPLSSTNSPPTPITTFLNNLQSTGQPLKGAVQAGTDDPESRTVIKVDGRVYVAGYGALTLDTTRLTNGYHDIEIIVTRPDGTVEVTKRRILVDNDLSPWASIYNLVFQVLHFNALITNSVIFLFLGMLFGGIGVLLVQIWQRRLWETLPLVRSVHLGFLRNPHLLSNLFRTKATSHTQVITQQTNARGGLVVYGNVVGVPDLNIPLHIGGRTFFVNVPAAAFVLIFGLIGSLIVLQSLAAPNGRTVEPENGSRNGVLTLNDTSAAGGAYIQFGAGAVAACPAGQTGTPPNCKTPPKAFVSECLKRTGTIVTPTGLLQARYIRSITPNTVINATNLWWNGVYSNGEPLEWPITTGGDGPGCWFGGKYQGVWNDRDPNVTWADPYHKSGVITVRSPQFLVEGLRADNSGDGVRFEGNAHGFHVRGVYMSNMHDDCVENDHMNSGTIEDSLFDGCYAGISADHTNPTLDGSNDTMVFKNNLLYMKPMPTVFRGTAPGTAMLFKGWSGAGSPAPAMVIENNVFRIDQKPGFESHNIPSRMKITSCSNNVIVWLGPGEFPYNYPSCFRITKDINVWNAAVAKWKEDHANVFP